MNPDYLIEKQRFRNVRQNISGLLKVFFKNDKPEEDARNTMGKMKRFL